VVRAQVPRDFAIDLSAAVSTNVPRITLSWTQRLQSNITLQSLHRRLKGETVWVKQADLGTSQTSYADASAQEGVEYEYWIERRLSTAPSVAMGYLNAGVNIPMAESRGRLLLVIDDTMAAPLAPEIQQLKDDLAGDGWLVTGIVAPRAGTVAEIKALIKTAYDADPANVKLIYALGHVPVPYSGDSACDGHGNHGGAWPADGYYGDMDGVWTDATVNTTVPSRTQNQNVPGDGKFDQTQLPSLIEVGVGRVDLQRLGRSPSAISADVEVSHLRRYLNKAHAFRHKTGAYADIRRRSLIRDGFGRAFGNSPFATTAWAGAFTCVGTNAPIDEAPVGQWFMNTYAGGSSYLWGYGCGGGSYEYASGLGVSTDFGHLSSRVVFASVFGSYHGDWDSDNNLMRSILAGNATEDSLALSCYWVGWPLWFVHSLGMGETLGYMTRASMNAALAGGGGYLPSLASNGGRHLGLMGDPALRLHVSEPPRRLGITSSNGQVTLQWAPSTEPSLQGYHVYRAASAAGPFARLTITPLIGLSYTDATVTAGQGYTYLVRALKLERVPGGTYCNLSVGTPLAITVSAAATPAPFNPSELTVVSQSNAVNAQIVWQDNSGDESGFRVERRVNADGTWSTLASLPENMTAYTDVGPFAPLSVYAYRVVAQNSAGDSLPSNEEAFEASAGFVELTARTHKLNKSAGAAVLSVMRFGGGTGAVTVNYATANSTASAGVHYSAVSGVLSWADGETGIKTVSVPILNTATPQQARQFYVTLSSPVGGLRLGVFSRISVLIEDPSAALSAPWSQTLFGAPKHASAMTDAEGILGSTMIGGSTLNGESSETGRYIYQSRNGDGVLTAFVRPPAPNNTSARMALMVRDSLTTTSKMMAAATSSGSGISGYGTKLVNRLSVTSITTPGSGNSIVAPVWLRLTRFGSMFSVEYSKDGSSWTNVANSSSVLTNSALYWGLFNSAGDAAISSDYSADHQLSVFENVIFSSLPAPDAPDGVLTLRTQPAGTTLQWNTKPYNQGYRIERRAEGGVFEQIAQVAGSTASPQQYSDAGLAPDTAYEYRITGFNSTGVSVPSESGFAITPPADALVARTTDDSGGADATVRSGSPDTAHGVETILSTAGPGGMLVTNSAKSYLRFNLAGLSGTVKSANLELTVAGMPRFGVDDFFLLNLYLLNEESADVWSEEGITWNNAPLNDTASAGLLGNAEYAGVLFCNGADDLSPTGRIIDLNVSMTDDRIGTNGLLTLVAMMEYDSAEVDWASREHHGYAPPTLRLTLGSLLPVRPGFLTVSPAGGGGVTLQWAVVAGNGAGIELERRVAGGTFELLQTFSSNTATFTDTDTVLGVHYEYRIRSVGAGGDSAWTPVATLYATIAMPPADVSVTIGETATFSVTATGAAPLFYQWRRGGTEIPGATNAVYATPATVQADDGTVFSVTVSNTLGTVTSEGAVLTVRDPSRHALPYAEPFERFASGFMLGGFEGWHGEASAARVSAEAAVLDRLHDYAEPVGYPLRADAHAQVATLWGAVTNRLQAAAGASVWCDMMVELVPMTDGDVPSEATDMQCALIVDAAGRLNVWHRDLTGGSNRWSVLAWQTPQSSQWARVTLYLDYATADAMHNARYFRLFIDGEEQSHASGWSANDGTGTPGGTWFALAGGMQERIGALVFMGSGALDDLTVGAERPLIGLGQQGTPEWWLADNGLTNGLSLAENEQADADLDGFANWKEYAAGTDPNAAASLLRVIDLPAAANGRLGLVVQTVPGRRYTLQATTDLAADMWEEAAFAMTPEGAPAIQSVTAAAETLTLYAETAGPFLFYRVQVVP
jgi:hypothetical protein